MQKKGFDFVMVEGNGEIASFKMSTTVVTQGFYKAIMGKNPVEGYESYIGIDKPVVFVSWYDALFFCNTLSKKQGLPPCYSESDAGISWDESAGGYRLPTKAEWEWAAKGGKLSHGYTYSGSNDYAEVAVCRQKTRLVTKQGRLGGTYTGKEVYNAPLEECKLTDVATLKPNELGLYDMSGLVEEWCWDEVYYKYDDGTSSSCRVIRGGNWFAEASQCGVSYWFSDNPDGGSGCYGFRVVRSAN